MLAGCVGYQEPGETYRGRVDQTRTVANLKRRLERLGYVVTIEPKTIPAVTEPAATAAA